MLIDLLRICSRRMVFKGNCLKDTPADMVEDIARPEDLLEDMEIVNISIDICEKTCLRTWPEARDAGRTRSKRKRRRFGQIA